MPDEEPAAPILFGSSGSFTYDKPKTPKRAVTFRAKNTLLRGLGRMTEVNRGLRGGAEFFLVALPALANSGHNGLILRIGA